MKYRIDFMLEAPDLRRQTAEVNFLRSISFSGSSLIRFKLAGFKFACPLLKLI